jgi:hypothetical protein
MSPQPEISALFEPLNGARYPSYVELEGAVRARFREERVRFPSEFSYRDAISWATSQGVIAVEDNQLVIRAVAATS